MAEFKLTISNSKGKTVQREAKGDDAKPFVGKKIGEKINGEVINLTGYEFEITGGSDHCGFPMRKDVKGVGRKRILEVKGVGVKKKKGKGVRQRRTVCGNTIHSNIVQINLKALKQGKEDIFTVKEGEKKKEAKEEKEEKKEALKEEKKEEKKKEEKKEELKKEEKKEEVKEEKKPEVKEEKKDVPSESEADKAK